LRENAASSEKPGETIEFVRMAFLAVAVHFPRLFSMPHATAAPFQADRPVRRQLNRVIATQKHGSAQLKHHFLKIVSGWIGFHVQLPVIECSNITNYLSRRTTNQQQCENTSCKSAHVSLLFVPLALPMLTGFTR